MVSDCKTQVQYFGSFTESQSCNGTFTRRQLKYPRSRLRLFYLRDEFLTAVQIGSFFSRMAAKLRNAVGTSDADICYVMSDIFFKFSTFIPTKSSRLYESKELARFEVRFEKINMGFYLRVSRYFTLLVVGYCFLMR